MLNTRFKCLLLNSGGYDSTVLLYYLKMFGYETWSLTFNYGQPSTEITYAKKNARSVGIPENRILTHDINMNHCIDNALDVSNCVGDVGYIPMRNTIFLAYALSLAETLELNTISLGILGCGSFADNNPYFIEDFRPVAGHIGVQILSPLDQLEKKDVYVIGNTFGISIEDTWSCNTPTNINSEIIRCGVCTDCSALKDAIRTRLIVPKSDIKFHI